MGVLWRMSGRDVRRCPWLCSAGVFQPWSGSVVEAGAFVFSVGNHIQQPVPSPHHLSLGLTTSWPAQVSPPACPHRAPAPQTTVSPCKTPVVTMASHMPSPGRGEPPSVVNAAALSMFSRWFSPGSPDVLRGPLTGGSAVLYRNGRTPASDLRVDDQVYN